MWTKIAAVACAAALLGGCDSGAGSSAAGGDPTTSAASSFSYVASAPAPSTTLPVAPPTARAAAPSTTRVAPPSTTRAAPPSTSRVIPPPTTRAPSPSATPRPGTVITVASSQFGPVLFDGSGQAIYLFDAETTSRPTCYGDCASAWPPVLTKGRPVARGGVQADLLGVTTRRDGSTQVTYNGKPLYFYAHEGKNVVLCHNIREFGGLWLALTKSGAPVPT
jgi:predicted lipoprotein with Yx(FWY)xxD motif